MPWHARLRLDYRLEGGRTLARHRHEGPLRILQSLYPEGDRICHNVLVHPPGGLVGGDLLDLDVTLGAGAHALLTTPGATRFYRSEGELAAQRTRLTLEAGARLEWLPLPTLCSSGCRAENTLELRLAPGAELIGWDICALGLPASGQPFEAGSYLQQIELPGVWLERGRIDAADHRLLNGTLGLAGQRCLASIYFAAGSPLARPRREALLDLARATVDQHAPHANAGATSPNAQVVVLRMLAPLTEPALELLRKVRLAWRTQVWDSASTEPRGWSI